MCVNHMQVSSLRCDQLIPIHNNTYLIILLTIDFSFRKCRVKRRNARRNKNINVLNTEFKRTAKISNLEVAQV